MSQPPGKQRPKTSPRLSHQIAAWHTGHVGCRPLAPAASAWMAKGCGNGEIQEVASSSTHGGDAGTGTGRGRFDMLAVPIGRSTRRDRRVGTWATKYGTGRPPRSPPDILRRWARPPARMRSLARVARATAGRAEHPSPRACGPAPPPRARPQASIAQWAEPAAWGAHPPPLGPPCALLCACELRDHLEGRTSSATSLGQRGSEGTL